MLGFAFGLAVLVGNTIGVGILRTPGEVAARLPSVPLFMGVWVVGAAYALLGALTIAELAALRPRSGGLYPLVADAIGGYAGFVAGWTDWLALAVASGAVALVLGEYAGPLIPALAGHAALVGSAVIVAFVLLQWRGIHVGDVVQQITSLVKADRARRRGPGRSRRSGAAVGNLHLRRLDRTANPSATSRGA